LPALSALARKFSHACDWGYLAGIWADDKTLAYQPAGSAILVVFLTVSVKFALGNNTKHHHGHGHQSMEKSRGAATMKVLIRRSK
jgi:hypothetical protein